MRTKKITAVILTFLLLFASITFISANGSQATIKNVIFLIPDGTSVAATTIARWYKGEALALDEMATGLVRTYWAGGPITDSAPGGTALATGYKTWDKYVATLPSSEEKRPVATLLEAAKLKNKAVGIVSTSEVMHATPADFTAHFPDRSNYDVISEQQVYNGLDVVLGGGSHFFSKEGRGDGEDLIAEIKNLGYDYVTTPEELKASTSDKLWGLFAPAALDYDFDRDPSKQASLAEMTQKAIEVLSKDEDGFFLMVEGSKIDWAAHSNDITGVLSDVLAFDDAVKVALDFAKQNGETVIVSATDHGTGGISVGAAGTNKSYSYAPLSTFLEPLKAIKLTTDVIHNKLNKDKSNVAEVMAEYFGIKDLTEAEIEAIKSATGGLSSVVGPMISKRACIGWTTTGHTGEDVPLYIYSPNSDKLSGVVENTDVAKYIARVLGLDLDEATAELFVKARAAFEAKGAIVEWDNSDIKNPVVIVTKGEDILKLPVYKNIAELNGVVIRMNGLTIFNGICTYVPQEAVDLIK